MGPSFVLAERFCKILAVFVFFIGASSASALELKTGTFLECRNDLRLYVGRITPISGDAVAVHVQMFENGVPFAAHLPFAPEAFRTCKQVRQSDAAVFDREAFQSGFNEWQSANGGVFTKSPRDVRKMILEITGG